MRVTAPSNERPYRDAPSSDDFLSHSALSVVRLSGRTPSAFEIQCMIKRTNDARPLMRAGCRLALPFLILSLATFAYSQEQPSIFLDDFT